MRKLELTALGESSARALAALSNAKNRFEDARKEATKAFANEALELSDRVLAMQYRVMATILETVDNPKDAIPACRVCTEDLHRLSVVQKCFNIELNTKGLRAWFSRDERRKIISIVCRVNRAIYDVMQTVDGDVNLWSWPCVHCGEEKVDPLRDSRVVTILSELGMDDSCVTSWSFGQEGKVDQKLKKARGIVTNTQGQFIIGDNEDCNRNLKVFNNKEKFLRSFCLPSDDERTSLSIYDVATDVNDNIYVLVRLMKPGADNNVYISVYVYEHTPELHHKFNMRYGPWDWFWFALTVNDNNKVMVVASKVVDVYETDGQFVRTLGQGILEDAEAITAANEGRVMVVDNRNSYVHVFSEQGEHLLKFRVQGYYFLHKIAFHRNSKHVIVAGTKERWNNNMCILICTKDGEFLRGIQLGITEKPAEVTVTKEGRFAVVCNDVIYPSKVLVV